MENQLRAWRQRGGLTQVEAAERLGVSQTYLSLMEKGARPVTEAIRDRMRQDQAGQTADQRNERFRSQVAALGYPGFAHVARTRTRPKPDRFLLSVLGAGDADARVVEALPWVVRTHIDRMDLEWLTREAKLGNLQNRLGFVLDLAATGTPAAAAAIGELERSRLLAEATLCWDSMPAATRAWMREHRSPLAARWNVLTRICREDEPDAA